MKLLTYVKYIKQKVLAKKYKSTLKSIYISSDFKYGNYCIFGKKCYIEKNVSIGNYNYFNANQLAIIIESNTKMGSFCSIAPGVLIGLGNHDVNKVSTHPILFNPYYSKLMNIDFKGDRVGLKDVNMETKIGSDVWIGARATIKRGIVVNDGAVIAGEAVVTKDVPAYAIVGGIPAKIIGYRFEDKVVKFLNENALYTFWNWDEEYFKTHLGDLNNVEDYLKCVKAYRSDH